MGEDGAIESWTEGPETRVVPKAEWDVLRKKTVAMKYEDWEHHRTVIEKLCSDTPLFCRGENKQRLQKAFVRVNENARRAKRVR